MQHNNYHTIHPILQDRTHFCSGNFTGVVLLINIAIVAGTYTSQLGWLHYFLNIMTEFWVIRQASFDGAPLCPDSSLLQLQLSATSWFLSQMWCYLASKIKGFCVLVRTLIPLLSDKYVAWVGIHNWLVAGQEFIGVSM